MTVMENDAGGTKWPYFVQKLYTHTSYDIGQGHGHKISKINLENPPAIKSSKVDPDDLIFPPICSEHVDSFRASISSLKVKGQGIEEPKNLSLIRRYAGVLFALLATVNYSFASLCQKSIRGYHPVTIATWRFMGLIIPTVPIMLYHLAYEKRPIFESVWPPTEATKLKNIFFLTLRATVGSACIVFQIYALQYMDLADVTVILCSSPVFIIFTARIFLGEKAGWFAVVISVFTVTGVTIIARPPLLTGEPINENTVLGITFALVSMLLATLAYVMIRYIRDVHYSMMTISYGVVSTLQCIAVSLVIGAFEFPKTGIEWAYFAGLLAATWGGQTALVVALQLEQCGVVSLINSLDSCFAFVLQFVFLGVIPDKYSLIGASIIVSSVLVTTLRKYVATLPEDNKIRQRFRLILK